MIHAVKRSTARHEHHTQTTYTPCHLHVPFASVFPTAQVCPVMSHFTKRPVDPSAGTQPALDPWSVLATLNPAQILLLWPHASQLLRMVATHLCVSPKLLSMRVHVHLQHGVGAGL